MKVLIERHENHKLMEFSAKLRCRSCENQYPNFESNPNNHCGSTLEICERDLSTTTYNQITTSGVEAIRVFYVVCPICKQNIVVSNHVIPDYIKHKYQEVI